MPNKKNNQRYQATETKIKQAYLSLAAKHPDKRVKVIDLCAEAAVNRATFYAHYYDVDAVAEAIQRDMMSELTSALKETDLVDIFTKVLTLIKANRQFFYHVFVTEQAPGSLDVLRELAPRIEAVRTAQSEAMFSYQLTFFNGGMAALFKQWLEEDCRTSISALVAFLMGRTHGIDAP